MLQCTMYEKTMKIKVSGADAEFKKDLMRMVKTIPARDREFIGAQKAWIISHPERYVCIKEVKAAIEDRKRQPMLF